MNKKQTACMQITLSIVYCTPYRIVAATVLILKSCFFYLLLHLDWKQNTRGGCAARLLSGMVYNNNWFNNDTISFANLYSTTSIIDGLCSRIIVACIILASSSSMYFLSLASFYILWGSLFIPNISPWFHPVPNPLGCFSIAAFSASLVELTVFWHFW